MHDEGRQQREKDRNNRKLNTLSFTSIQNLDRIRQKSGLFLNLKRQNCHQLHRFSTLCVSLELSAAPLVTFDPMRFGSPTSG